MGSQWESRDPQRCPGKPQKRQTKIDSAATAKARVPKFSFIKASKSLYCGGGAGQARRQSTSRSSAPESWFWPSFLSARRVLSPVVVAAFFFFLLEVSPARPMDWPETDGRQPRRVRRGGRQSIDPGPLTLVLALACRATLARAL